MPEFDDGQRALTEARSGRDQAAGEAFAARERLRRTEANLSALARVFDPENPDHVGERDRLVGQRAEAERALKAGGKSLLEASERLSGASEAFSAWTDPTRSIGELDDGFPILMLPVRLETRFKTVPDDEGGSLRQLWVRIYPDDCSIDTFDPVLSEAEVKSAKRYWTGIWEAGGFEDQERGAWRGLVASHGSGRAEWIVAHYEPANLIEAPTKAAETDFVLTIPTETALTGAEPSATEAFWRAVWLADGDQVGEQAARTVLEGVVGQARASQIVETYPPANLAKKPPPPLSKADVAVSTAFVVFPDTASLDIKRHSWSRAPVAKLLPERFVFIGYTGSQPPLVRLGNLVPSDVVTGPDPSLPQDEQLQEQDGEILVPDPMQWMVDFDRAVQDGMGFRITLPPGSAEAGFDRVLVLGIRMGADQAAAKAELESLITHHRFGRRGFALVPQGTATNNTDMTPSGFTRIDDPDASFDALRTGAAFPVESGWLDKRDGQWLAEYLGIDPVVLQNVRHGGGLDQADARAMNVALWPATLGYWTQSMLAPVFGESTIDSVRAFFAPFVSGRGAIPAVRIGTQPYGVLPATAFSRMRWLEQRELSSVAARGRPSFLFQLYQLLLKLAADWSQLSEQAAFAGKAGDAHGVLLDLIGLHPGSVEFWQRYAESMQLIFNVLNLAGRADMYTSIDVESAPDRGVDLLRRLGYSGDEKPEILSTLFFRRQQLLTGPIVDDRPLSEVEGIRAYTDDGRNYVQWLVDAAQTSLDALYTQEGFTGDEPPTALLYLMLRHALQLGYHDESIRLHEVAGVFDQDSVRAARRDVPFLHIDEQAPRSESRYQLLYKTEPAITGSPTMSVGEFIGTSLAAAAAPSHLADQVEALQHLVTATTGRLERAFTEHVDCCSYRLDAWLLGLVHYQLGRMRNLVDGGDGGPHQGTYLGAYAWLQDLRPQARSLFPVSLSPDLDAIFHPEEFPRLERDSTNQGFVHAPSLNQAVAAAVLRNGYLANATKANDRTLAVNLSSERVRLAIGMLEGIRGGQGLGALLGYQFERGLHDRHGSVEVDEFIYDIRKAFPFRADHLGSTQTGADVPIEAIEARNVVDGLALVEHIKATGQHAYPFGKDLPAASQLQRDAINAEVDRLLDTEDAVADLALAEGVYQAVLGNYDRVASTYDAFSKGDFPPQPQVVQTPATGIGLTHRFALHLEAGVDPTTSPVPAVPVSPRANAQAALNRWLAGVLPPLGEIACVVSFQDAATNTQVQRQVRMLDLGLQPIDLIYLMTDQHEQAMTELDDRIVLFTGQTWSPRPDIPISIRYRDKTTAELSVFEVTPLVRALRSIALLSRPLRPSDLALTGEATADRALSVDSQRVALVRNRMQAVHDDLAAFQGDLSGPLDDLANRRDELIGDLDANLQQLTTLLPRTARFAVPQAGWGFTHEFSRRAFTALLRRCADLVERWNDRLSDFDDLLTDYGNLPPSATDAEKFGLLQRAERLVSTTPTTPLPGSPDDLEAILLTKRGNFTAKRAQFAGISGTNRTSVKELLDDIRSLLPITAFDATAFSLVAEEDDIVRFSQDALSVVTVVLGDLARGLTESQDLLQRHDDSAAPAARVQALQDAGKALLGEDFVLIPEFDLSPPAGDEMANAFSASRSGALFDYVENTANVELPLDTWLYGLARVRDKVRAWEQVVMLSSAFDTGAPELDVIQLPFLPGDSWLGLQFPSDSKLDTERLVYTAHFAAPFQRSSPQAGLLMDEWSEVIPSATSTTGITFHYDRPNSEAPQAMLLVTPAEFTGAWAWADLVDALNQTLDLAKLRAVEPVHLDSTAYSMLLPATVMAATARELTIAADIALNNNLAALVELS